MTYNKIVSHVGGWLFIIHYTRPANLTAVCGHFLMIIVLDAVPKTCMWAGGWGNYYIITSDDLTTQTYK